MSKVTTFTPLLTSIRHCCYRAAIGRNPRPVYSRMYDVQLVKPDGSSVRIKYNEPVAIIKLPFDINTLSEEERKKVQLRRQMSLKVKKKTDDAEVRENKEIKYDPRKYVKM